MVSKFSAALSGLKDAKAKPPAVETEAPPAVEPEIPPTPRANALGSGAARQSEENGEPAKRGRGRPAGKRSNPDYDPTTILLRKATKRAVNRRLDDTRYERADGDPEDLSDVVEMLLQRWLASEIILSKK